MVELTYTKILDVPGLYYLDDIKENTYDIITNLDKLEWKAITPSKNSRKVQHYGYKYDYKTSNIYAKADDIPDFLLKLKKKLTQICLKLNIIDKSYEFNQCIINNYNSGQGISAHIDNLKYGKVIGCFSVGCDAKMKFSQNDKTKDIIVNNNSVYIMSDDARYKWKHSMIGSKKNERRISITFRNVKITK